MIKKIILICMALLCLWPYTVCGQSRDYIVPFNRGASSEIDDYPDPSQPDMGNWPCDGDNYNGYTGHEGVDYVMPVGTPLYAAAAGTVSRYSQLCGAGSNCYGYYMGINHGGGRWTLYAHLSSYVVANGAYVAQGQLIAYSGQSGPSYPHLHFEVLTDVTSGPVLGKPNNPYYCDNEWFVSSPPMYADEFNRKFIQYNGFTFNAGDPNALFTCPVEPSGGSAANGWVYTCPQAQDALSECDGTSMYRWNYGVLRVDNLRRNVTFRARLYRLVNGAPTIYGNNTEWSWTNNSVEADGGWDHAYFWPSEVCLEAGDFEWWYYVDSGGITMDLPLVRLPFTVKLTNTPYLVNTGSGNPISCGDPPQGGENTNWTYTCLDQRLTYNAGQHVWTLFRIDRVYRDHRYKVSAFNNGIHQWDWTSDWVRGVSRRWGWEKTYFWPALWNAPRGDWRFYYRVDTGDGFPTAPAASVDFMVR